MAETQDEKNAELFEQVWEKASARIDLLTSDPQEQKFLKSIIMGGTVAAEAVVGATSVRKYWGEGTIAMVNEISQLFAFLMLSQCFRWVAKGEGSDQTVLSKEVSATKLIFAFETEPEQSISDFTHFDEQYNYDLENKPHIVHTASFLLAKACEIAGHRCVVWERVKFPVVELTHLAKKGVILDSEPIRSQEDIDMVTNSISAGLQAMNKFHDETA